TGDAFADWLEPSVLELPMIVAVIDRRGSVLASSQPGPPQSLQDAPWIDDVLAAPEGSSVVNGPDGALVVTFATIQGTDWKMTVREPAQDIIGPILRFSGLGPIAAAIAAGLSLVILAFGWRTIVRPLQQLSNAAEEVTGGQYQAIEAPISGVVEIEDLHQALGEMVARIEGYQAGVLDYLDAMTKGQEEERARLAREIHDGSVQSLIALTQRTEMAAHNLERGEIDGARKLLDQLRATEVQIVEDLRRMIGAIRPAYLEDLGFEPALEMLVRHANARGDTEVHLQMEGNSRRLGPEAELAAYRIAQEALNNALQHADADRVTVRARRDERGLLLEVSDNGAGFRPAARLDTYTREGHFGLIGLQERVRQLGGTLEIVSAPGEGTRVRVRLPDSVPDPD
ncbi:MAG: ATP-binding protein, partial [Anaerolineae bacterium]